MTHLDRTIAPDFKEIKSINFLKPNSLTLNNGIKLFFLDASETELIRIEFIFDRTPWNKKNPLIINAANSLLNEGTSKYLSNEIADKIDYYGAFYQNETTFKNSSITLYSLNKYLKNTLPLIKEIITDAIFPENEINTYKQTNKQKLSVNLEKNNYLSRRLFNNAMFGQDSIYGYNLQQTDYDLITQNDLLEIKRSQYISNNCTIIVSGKVKQDEINIISDFFGNNDWFGNNIEKPNNIIKQSTELKHYIERADSVQSSIRLGKMMIPKTHQDFHSLFILNTVLGGYFGSRLMSNIREDKGYTYGIGSSLVTLNDLGYFTVATDVGIDVTQNTINEIHKEINILKNDIIPDKELSLVKNYILGSIQGSLENTFSHIDKFKELYLNNLDYTFYDNFIQKVQNISSKELIDIANKYFEDPLIETIVGKK